MPLDSRFGKILRVTSLFCFILFSTVPLHAAKVLRVGVYNNNPTIFMDSEGKANGLFVELLEDIAVHEDWQLEYIFGHWAGVYNLLKQGEIDILPAVAFSQEREEFLDYSDETVMANWAQIYTHHSQSISSMLDLEGKKIAVKAGDIHFAALKKLTSDFNITCRFIEAEDYETVLEMIDANYIDLGVVNRLFGNRNRHRFNVKIAPVVFNPIEMRYAEPKGKGREIISKIDAHLVTYKYHQDSLYYKATKRWSMEENEGAIPRQFWYLLAAVFSASVLFLGGCMLFRDQVKRRTRELTSVNNQLALEVTDRVKAEDELRVSIERINAFFRAVNDAILIHPLLKENFSNFIEVNQVACDRYGYTRDEFLNISARDITCQEDANKHSAADHRQTLFENGQLIFETTHIKKTGETFPVEINSNIVELDGKHVIIAVVRDISERLNAQAEQEQLETQLHQAQKMDSIGLLAGGVAHDFNNMLGVILGHTEMALYNMDSSMPLYSNLREIRKAAERSANLTRQLLAFARKQTIAPKVLDLNETVLGMLKMLQRLIGENITLTWRPGSDIFPIKMDPGQVDQILANLCINGRDAIKGIGKITISTKNVTLNQKDCAGYAGFTPGQYVLLEVRDSGSGMDEEILEKIFDPFFTTKQSGAGTGLGLATVYGIVKQNRGFIYVTSEPLQGSTFKIYLPRQIGDNGDQFEDQSIPTETADQRTILLVEDEAPFLEITEAMLLAAGFSVISASSPGEALEIVQTRPTDIDLLLTDVVMPEMSGLDLHQNLHKTLPQLNCLFMSGYTADVISNHGVLKKGVHFIAKPFTKAELIVAIQKVLDNR
ncbi:MAG: ATP-binding protein [Desulforhopalus sp.]